jgi:putative endopeptidase
MQFMRNISFILVLAGLFVACQSPDPTSTESASFTGFNPEWLDSSIAPCEDFAAFTSNGWKEQNPIPSSEGRWGSFNLLIEENNRRIRVLLDQLIENEYPKGTYEQQIRDFYVAAMDTQWIEKNGETEVNKVLALFTSLDEKADLPMVFAEMKKRGIRTPFTSSASADDKRSDYYILKISQSGLGLPDKDYYLKEDEKSHSIQESYEQHIAKMLGLAGIANAEAKASAIMALETRMASHQMSREDRRIPELTYNKLSTNEFAAWLSEFEVSSLFAAIGFDGDTLLCGQPDYIKNLNQILGETDLNTWKAYSQWQALSAYQEALPSDFRNAHFDFYGKTLKGLKEQKPRWKIALGSIENGQSESLGRIYVDEYFPESHKKRIADMVENIRAAYGERIDQLSWMSDETKAKAHEKLKAFTYKIGYPDSWKDYSSMEIGNTSMVHNLFVTSAYRLSENMAKVDQKVDPSEWFMGAHIVNAYYNPSFNEIVFPAGILQPPFFDPMADDALNYGAIGGVIGHEFTHGFDDQGSKYGPAGNLENWWTDEDRARFDELAARLVEQYNQFEALPGEFVNGRMTLGENIADLGGLTIAYYAYQRSLKGKKTPEKVDGFTHDQRFFMGWAGVWQVDYTDEALRDRLMTDYHSPGHFRVKGPMQNMNEFKEAWGCSSDQSMLLEDSNRVVIW